MEIKTEKRDNAQIILVSGMLDASNYQKFEEDISLLIQGGPDKIVFNLSNLEYMSSAGVRAFLKTNRTIKSKEGVMVFCCLKPFIKEVFEIAGLDVGFKIFADVESAVQFLDA